MPVISNVRHFVTSDVFRIPGKEWFVRHSVEHGWGCPSGDGPFWFSEKGNFMPLLPLLEMPWPAATNLVQEAIERHAGVTAFPFDSTVLCALAWPTEHWPTMAVQWLEQGFPLSEEATMYLETISRNKAMPQRLRHRCLALVKGKSRGANA